MGTGGAVQAQEPRCSAAHGARASRPCSGSGCAVLHARVPHTQPAATPRRAQGHAADNKTQRRSQTSCIPVPLSDVITLHFLPRQLMYTMKFHRCITASPSDTDALLASSRYLAFVRQVTGAADISSVPVYQSTRRKKKDLTGECDKSPARCVAQSAQSSKAAATPPRSAGHRRQFSRLTPSFLINK